MSSSFYVVITSPKGVEYPITDRDGNGYSSEKEALAAIDGFAACYVSLIQNIDLGATWKAEIYIVPDSVPEEKIIVSTGGKHEA